MMESHKRAGADKPVYSGKQATGRIKELVRSQASGTISSSNGSVFFHKSDVDGEYWNLAVGDHVLFDLPGRGWLRSELHIGDIRIDPPCRGFMRPPRLFGAASHLVFLFGNSCLLALTL